jgi:D-arabinose 1-dehydrogenase-like Zn-dependent alcohol dehydrogenase
MGVNAAGRREADGDYRDEGDGTRPHSFQLDAASCGTTKAFMGRPRRNRHHSEYADQAGNLQLQSLVTHQHLRFAELSGVRPMIETYPLEKAAEAYARMLSGKAQFRVVLTM